MRYAETMFHLAEAAQKGYSVGVDAQTAYNAAVTGSLLENGIEQADVTAYLTGNGTYDGTLETIYL